MKKIWLITILMQFAAFDGFAHNVSMVQNFLKEAKQKKVFHASGSVTAPAKPAAKIHFFWASWCEFCDQSYDAIVSLEREPSINGKIQILTYCLDDMPLNNKAKKKLRKMNKFEQSLLDPSIMKTHPQLGRLPAFVLEDTSTGAVEAYTGFSNERFHYLRKKILKAVRSEQSNEE